jgi:3-phenylpropionate/trans-cinnamate dioxygenase ferredoxin reductase component
MSSSSTSGVCVVGAGQAAVELAMSLRQQGYGGPITLLGEERWLPYQRPPLSKAGLVNGLQPESIVLRRAEVFAQSCIQVETGSQVVRVDVDSRILELQDGRRLQAEHIVFATGGRARCLRQAGKDIGAGCDNWHVLRSLDDLLHIREQWIPGATVAIVGGGYIGLEVAASALKSGLKPVVIEGQPRVLARVTAPEVSAFYADVHREAGVELLTGVNVNTLQRAGRKAVALDTSVGRIAADLFIVGIGLEPAVELAAVAGLATDNGIVVDSYLRTAAPHVLAIGDCAAHPSIWTGTRLRLESVPNAAEQAKVAAAAICGIPQPYKTLPWFWSDQYDLKLQMVGLSAGYEQVVLRGSPAARSFLAVYLREGRVVAVDAISRPGEFMVAKRLVSQRVIASPERLADESLPLRELLS